MKSKYLLISVFFLFSFTSLEVKSSSILNSQDDPKEVVVNDKKFLLDYFERTKNDLQQSVKGLNNNQLQFKASPDKWSVSQCLEHIILTEKALLDMAKGVLQKPANPERKGEVKISDDDLINGITDRTAKAKAPEALQPEGIYTDPKTAMKALNAQRTEILTLINQNTEEDMRNHIGDSPFGPIDAYQSFLFIAGHTARHTLQLKEVKADAGFPAK